jgi:hypothetical protein
MNDTIVIGVPVIAGEKILHYFFDEAAVIEESPCGCQRVNSRGVLKVSRGHGYR